MFSMLLIKNTFDNIYEKVHIFPFVKISYTFYKMSEKKKTNSPAGPEGWWSGCLQADKILKGVGLKKPIQYLLNRDADH